jgi:anti-sigma B factor antagonist
MRESVVPGAVEVDATIPIPARTRLVSVPTLAPPAHPVPGGHVRIRGRLDVRTVADVRLMLHDAIDSGSGELLVDVAAAEIGDATGLGVLVGAHHRARRAGRQLVLLDISERLDRLLHAARLHRVLACRSSADMDLLRPAALAPSSQRLASSRANPGDLDLEELSPRTPRPGGVRSARPGPQTSPG